MTAPPSSPGCSCTITSGVLGCPVHQHLIPDSSLIHRAPAHGGVAVDDHWETWSESDACRRCGCTDDHACEGSCYWVEPGLCSKCWQPPFWRRFVHNAIAHPLLVIIPPVGEWLHDRTTW